MCTFVTAGLPVTADLTRIRTTVGPPSHALRPLENPSVQKYLGAGSRYYRAYESVCDCHVALGRAVTAQRRQKPAAAEVPSLRRKGWSQAKISRWLLEKEDAVLRKAAERQARASD